MISMGELAYGMLILTRVSTFIALFRSSHASNYRGLSKLESHCH